MIIHSLVCSILYTVGLTCTYASILFNASVSSNSLDSVCEASAASCTHIIVHSRKPCICIPDMVSLAW